MIFRITSVPFQLPMAGALSAVLLALGVSLFGIGAEKRMRRPGSQPPQTWRSSRLSRGTFRSTENGSARSTD
jgi:hypothetical protein